MSVLLRTAPQYRWDMLILTAWGTIMAALMWRAGPWMAHMVPFFWPLQAAALLSWLLARWWLGRQDSRLSRTGASEAGRLTHAA